MTPRHFFNFLIFTLSLSTSPAFSFTPMEYYNSFVAGFDTGYRDGAFNKARFDDPCGIAFDTNGDRLFVADRNNNRVRLVYLNEDNRVETLAGTGTEGKIDGSLLQASFNNPLALVYLPGDILVVYDAGSNLLRNVDLKTKMVTTLAQIPETWNLAYRELDNSLYFSEPSTGAVQKLDLKTKKISTVFSADPKVPHPKAICVNQNIVYVADSDLPDVYEIDPNSAPSTINANLLPVGKGDHILEMTYSDNFLYALQSGLTPLAHITPYYQAVSLATAWGYLAENDNEEAEPLLNFPQSRIGFAASPKEKRKLFVSYLGHPSIISVKDYDFNDTWTTEAQDFNYPSEKPQKTFRILMVGASRLLLDPIVVSKTAWTPSLRTNTYAKKLEFWLNVEASLQNVDTHFEVLTLAHTNENELFFSNYEVPPLVKKYDIDLVLVSTNLYFDDYFYKPLTSEGIPSLDDDPKFALKPIESRIPPGAPARFYARCKELGIIPKIPMNDYIQYLKLDDPEIRADLMEMMGLPVRLLANKLNAIKNKEGKSTQFAIYYMPWDYLPEPEENYDLFWKDLCQKNNVTLISLGDQFTLLQTGFYPAYQETFAHHFTAYGHELIAYLLSRYLIDQKLIPFEPEKNSSK